MNNYKIAFYHVEQAKKYSHFLSAHINKELSEQQFTQMINAIELLKQLTKDLYEKSQKN